MGKIVNLRFYSFVGKIKTEPKWVLKPSQQTEDKKKREIMG